MLDEPREKANVIVFDILKWRLHVIQPVVRKCQVRAQKQERSQEFCGEGLLEWEEMRMGTLSKQESNSLVFGVRRNEVRDHAHASTMEISAKGAAQLWEG